VVATETPSAETPSGRIVDFCQKRGIPVLVTSASCRSVSDRAWEVAKNWSTRPDVVVNLQGDNPTCPSDFIVKIVAALGKKPEASVASIYTRLDWSALDRLRESKKSAPFSGTTVALGVDGTALWFSKNIIPAIRDEVKLRETEKFSPVCRHVGVYAYRYDALKFFAESDKSRYEELEQLEQLRFLENGYKIQMTRAEYPLGYENITSGVDSPEDLARAAAIIREFGEIN
ncbi:MAG: 3-deoxy-manno-octulosonate cytidylyltransferase, partial [Thermoguttaceae bacterium]|nr:3-deoxy-manno-octulosonate cytidylyltransferase [Thermoguttaceae bacterium]